jgi:hypothetical protein
VGVGVPYADVGMWDFAIFHASGGPVTTTLLLQWQDPRADYDLYLYPPGSLDDSQVTEQPIAVSENRVSGPGTETIRIANLPPAEYVVAVVPHVAVQARYDLYGDPGYFEPTGYTSPGVRIFCPDSYQECFPL